MAGSRDRNSPDGNNYVRFHGRKLCSGRQNNVLVNVPNDFPTGIFFFLVAAIFVEPGSIHQSSGFITAWFIMMCGGLLQWFLIVPGLFEKPGLTTLNLETSAPLPSLGSQNITLPLPEVIQPAPVAKATVLESPAPVQSKAIQLVSNRTRTRKPIKSIAAFDRTGRTPLERVIDHL